MLVHLRISALCILSVVLYSSLTGMIYDNRYFPWYLRTYSRTCAKPSCIIPDFFLITGHSAFGTSDKGIGIPEIWGQYKENMVGRALEAIGKPNPIPLQYQSADITWIMDGKIEAQGFAITYNQQIGCYLSAGFSLFAMHLFTRNDFEISPDTIDRLKLTQADIDELDAARRSMNNTLGLLPPKTSVSGFSDIDCYIRLGALYDYEWKFKRIDTGLKLGLLIPSGKVRDINNPASLPFGGDGLWGIYLSADGEFELKEDWIVGFLARFNQRFKKRKFERLPAAEEQPLYGAIVAPVKIDPGVTGIISPYLQLNNIRDGLGLQVKYTGVWHDEDVWHDKRPDRTLPVKGFRALTRATEWVAEYITITGFYDFSALYVAQYYTPTVSLMWDIPVAMFGAERSAKTNRISLGVQFSF